MKRRIACLLAAAALLLAAPVRAEDYTLEQKLLFQIRDSAFRATVTFAAEGETAVFGDDAWALIRQAAPRLEVQVNSSVHLGRNQTTADLLADGESVARTDVRVSETLYAFASDLLAGADTFYAVSADWDAAEGIAALTEEEGNWPAVWPLLLSVRNADGEWSARAEKHLQALEMEAELWLGDMVLYDTGTTEDGVEYVELSCVVPGWEVKKEIRQLLTMVYRNEDLLGLLREICGGSARQYLQAGCLDSMLKAADALPLEGDLVLIRRFDTTGHPLLDEMTLPLGGESALEKIAFTSKYPGGKEEKAISCFLSDGSWGRFSWIAAGQTAYQGGIEWQGADGNALALVWDLHWDAGEETYNLSTDKFEKKLRAELNLRPLAGGAWPAQRLTAEATLSSGSRKENPTRLNGTLTWQDTESGGKITLTLAAKTAAAFGIEEIDEGRCTRLDQADAESLKSLAMGWIGHAGEWLEKTGRLLLGGE